MSAYPRNLGYMVSSIAGYHRNTFRIETTSTQTASYGRVVTVNLPENSIIDLKSFRWVIQDATTSFAIDPSAPAIAAGGTGATSGIAVKAALPFAQALIARLEISINGVQITQGCVEYNTLYRLMRNARITPSKASTIDNALQNGSLDTSPVPVTATSTTTSPAIVAGTSVNGQDLQMVICDFLGLFEAPSTRFLDTGLTGMISIRITLADNNVLTPILSGVATAGGVNTYTPLTGSQVAPIVGTTAVSTSPSTLALMQNMTYSLTNFYFTIDAISLNDGAYDMLVREKLARDGYLPLNFDEYYTFLQDNNTATTTTVRFAVSSQSINKLYATMRPSNYTSRGLPYDQTSNISSLSSITPLNLDNVQPNFFKFQSFAGDNTLKWNFSINNVYHPQFLETELAGLSHLIQTENKSLMESTGNMISSLSEYRKNKFCCGIRLNHPIDGEVRNAFTSGFDTRATNAQLLWQIQMGTSPNLTNALNAATVNGVSPTTYCAFIVVNTTNCLRVGPGRALELIT